MNEPVGFHDLDDISRRLVEAAALLQSVVNNHALADGNKRLGGLATAVFLEINGIEITAIENDEVYERVIEAAAQPSGFPELSA